MLGLASSVLTARALAPEGRGELAFVVTVSGVAAAVAVFGVDAGAIYQVARGKSKRVVQDVGSYATLVAVSLLAAATILFVFPRGGWHVALAFALAGPLVLQLLSSAILLGRRRLGSFNLLVVVQPSIFTAAVGVLYYLDALGVVAALLAFAGAQLATVALALFLARMPLGFRGVPQLRSLFSSSWKFGAANVMSFLNYRLDALVVGAVLGFRALGLYSTAVIVTERLWYIPAAVSNLLFPETAAAGRLTVEGARGFRVGLLLTLVAAAVLGLAAPFAIPWLFTASFTPSVNLVFLLLPGAACLGATKMLVAQLSGIGHAGYALVAASSAVTIDVVLLAVLVPFFGTTGVAIAASVAYAGTTIIVVWFYRRESGMSLVETLVPRLGDFRSLRLNARVAPIEDVPPV